MWETLDGYTYSTLNYGSYNGAVDILTEHKLQLCVCLSSVYTYLSTGLFIMFACSHDLDVHISRRCVFMLRVHITQRYGSVSLCVFSFRCDLFCSVPFRSALLCSVLFCSVLFCSVLFCSVPFRSDPFHSVLIRSVLY